MPEILLNGQTVAYMVRESGRARYLSLRIDSKNGLQVVIPKGARISQRDVLALLHDRADWILKHMPRYEADQHQNGASAFEAGSTMPYLGQPYPLHFVAATGDRTSITWDEGDGFTVRVPDTLRGPDRIDAIREAFGKWYSKQAKAYIIPLTEQWAQRMGLKIGTIRIKDQRTRWGSASSKSNLNFNRRLMMAPPEIIEYVIVHELCHFWEMNHSARFWARVGEHCPAYKRHRKWLRLNGPSLRL
jgi:predicted metal-dependent hydrolase